MNVHIVPASTYTVLLVIFCSILGTYQNGVPAAWHNSSLQLKPLLHKQQAVTIQTLPLTKQLVPVLRRGQVVAHKTAYSATIFIGQPIPQPFTVMFDTGSGHVFLPSENCISDVCLKRRRYHRNISTSVVDIDERGEKIERNLVDPIEVELVYNTGKVSGEFVGEVACLSDDSETWQHNMEALHGCARLGIVLANSLTTEPFDHFSFDGVVGLGLSSLALHRDFSFFGRLAEVGSLAEPCFSIFLAKGDGPGRSEISFGGHNQERAHSEFHWAPVALPDQGYWQVAIKSIRVGDAELSVCAEGGCSAVLDTGTSMLGVPPEVVSQLHRLTARPAETMEVDCRSVPGPRMMFDVGDFELELGAEDYSRPAPMLLKSKTGTESIAVCRSSLLPVPPYFADGVGTKVFVFGESFFQKHYTKFDWQQLRVGFALAKQPKDI